MSTLALLVPRASALIGRVERVLKSTEYTVATGSTSSRGTILMLNLNNSTAPLEKWPPTASREYQILKRQKAVKAGAKDLADTLQSKIDGIRINLGHDEFDLVVSFVEELPQSHSDMAISELGLPPNLRFYLNQGGIKTVGDLAIRTRADLLKLDRIRESSVDLVVQALRNIGVRLPAG